MTRGSIVHHRTLLGAVGLIVALGFSMFVLAWESRLKSEMVNELKNHAVAISDDVWNFNTRGTTAYLELIVDKDTFSAFTVYDEAGDEFARVDGVAPTGLNQLLSTLGLIRERHLIDHVTYGEQTIGRVEARYVNDAIYFYLYLLLPILLLLWAVKTYLGKLGEIERRKQLEADLRAERDLADKLIDTARVVILLLDAEGRIQRFNRYMEELSGFRLTEVKGKSWFSMFLPEAEAAKIRHVFLDTLENKETGGTVNVIVTRSGEHRQIEWYNNLLRNDDGSVAAVLSVGHDVTEIKRTESALRTAVNEAEVANKAKSLFLANMSHEVRTPMNGIALMLGALADTRIDNTQRGYLENAQRSVDRMVKILDEILDLSKIESGALVLDAYDFAVEELVQRCAELFRPMARGKGLDWSFESQIPEGLGWLRGDANRLEQVISNLIGNAIKFTEKGYVRCQLSLVGTGADHADLTVSIEDTGPGIPVERQKHIFDRFVQLSDGFAKRYEGAGLGLTIVRLLVEAMGGKVSVVSGVGRGSRFWFTVDLKRAQRAVPEPPRAILASDNQGKHILVVDDDSVSSLGARLMLEKAGFEVTVAENGQAALDVIGRSEMDGVLLDVHMPVLDGTEVARRIRKSEAGGARHLPLIGLTASVLKNERDQYIEAGMDAVLAKPFNVAQVVSTLRSVTAEITETH